MPNLIGQSLGRYHILEQLGEGGMATVYKAYDTRLETDVAVKVILTEKFTPEALVRTLKRFESEAKDMARLTHPNIVKVTDYGEYEGQPYLVMPYLPGGNLKQYLRDHGRLSWQEAVKILIPIAQALGFAHRQGVIHRDVKPANILLTQDGHPMLTDFGVAKVVEEEATHDLTGSGVGVGTPEYMAPEQTGRNFDQRVDIYALGIVFYEMVTGRRPYEGDTPLAVLLKQVGEPLPHPRQFTPGLPEAVGKVLFKALAKKPEDRFQNMDEFAIAMERLSSVPSGVTVKRWLPWGIGAAAMLLVLAVVWGLASRGWIPAPVFKKTPNSVALAVLTSTKQPTDTSQVTETSQSTAPPTITSLPTPTYPSTLASTPILNPPSFPIPIPSTSQVVSQVSVPGSGAGHVVATCPSGSIVTGGGFAASPSLLVFTTLTSSNGWEADAQNLSASGQALNAYAECLSNTSGTTQQVYFQTTASASGIGHVVVNCPSGSVVTGGGFASSSNLLVYSNSANGNGWEVDAQNTSSSNQLVNAYAICLSGTSGSIQQVVNQVSVAANGNGQSVKACPASTYLTGGGYAGNQNLFVYNESATGSSWQVYAQNTSTRDQRLNSYALCLTLP